MRTAWAVVLGIVLAGIAVWWLGRDDAPVGSHDTASPASSRPDPGLPPQRPLYRWRDDAGVVQLTDTPPKGRPYEAVDVAALERRNVFDPTSAPAPAE